MLIHLQATHSKEQQRLGVDFADEYRRRQRDRVAREVQEAEASAKGAAALHASPGCSSRCGLRHILCVA